jgi:branched-chain amino acid transport system substrate-binding protein
MKRLSLCLATLMAALSCTKGPSSANSNEIKIGQFGSMTGPEATFGQSTDKGLRLAIDARNAAGGIHGKKIVLITEDNQSKPEETTSIVKKLITQDKVIALIGEVASTRSLAAAPIAQKEKIPMITPSSTNPRVTQIGDYIFRVCFIDPVQGPIMAQFASDVLKFKKVAVLKDLKSDYSIGLAEFFEKKFKELGGQIVAEGTYSSNDSDFKAQLTQIRAAGPEAVFIPGYYNDVGPIGRQARELGLKATLLGGDGWDSPKLFELANGALEGSYFSNHYAAESPNPATQEFIKKYKEKYGEAPDGLAAAGYDAAQIMLKAIDNTKEITSANIRDEIAKIKDHEGATGKISINSERNADKDVFIVQVKGNGLKFIKVYPH